MATVIVGLLASKIISKRRIFYWCPELQIASTRVFLLLLKLRNKKREQAEKSVTTQRKLRKKNESEQTRMRKAGKRIKSERKKAKKEKIKKRKKRRIIGSSKVREI